MKRSQRLAAGLLKAGYSIKEMETLEKECDDLRKERDTLRRNRGKFAHGCHVADSYIGTHVTMGEDPVLRVMFFWHRGRPALRIRTVLGEDIPALEFAMNKDGTLDVIE